jgi:beta-lactamase regulating signal transducer with metallopeptidase domain
MAAAAEHQAALNQALNEIAKSDVTVKPGAHAGAQTANAVHANWAIAAPAAVHKTAESTAWSAISIRALGYGWLAIVIGLTAYLLLDMRRLRSLVARADAPSPALQRVFDDVSRELGLGKAPALRISDALDSPALPASLIPWF